jgi:putative inorganic carbon (HCO3(-)) transporter
MAVANPLFGVGLNAFSRFYNQYDSLNGLYGYRRSVHSIWFGILAELGIPAFMLFLTTLVLAIAGCSTVARWALRGDLPAEYYSHAVALQAAFAACLVGGSFLPFQYNEILWHFVGLSMALRAIAMNATVTSSAGLATPYSALGPRRFQSARAT